MLSELTPRRRPRHDHLLAAGQTEAQVLAAYRYFELGDAEPLNRGSGLRPRIGGGSQDSSAEIPAAPLKPAGRGWDLEAGELVLVARLQRPQSAPGQG
jgi:hypothetical protein